MKLKLFALNSSRDFGEEIASRLGVPLHEHDEFKFDDGECYVAPKPDIQENVRGCDVFVIESMYSDNDESINDKIVKLMIFMGALHDASAKRLTLVTPFYPYARQDRKTTSRAPITTKYLARLFKSVWADRILSLDVHNPTAIQNAFHVPVDLLEATNLFALYTKKYLLRDGYDNLVAMSPDSGGLGRTRKYRKVLSQILNKDVGIACLDKIHEGFHIRGNGIMGDVKDKRIIIYDDMISSGKSVLECVEACERAGAKEVLAVCASHGLFVGQANVNLATPFLRNVVITDTIKPFRVKEGSLRDKLHVINTTSLFAEAISRIHNNESITDLINNHLDSLQYMPRCCPAV